MQPLTLYKTLLSHFGEQHWWPASTRFEVMVGAILTQNNAWTNVETAIARMKKAKALSIPGLAKIPKRKLVPLIKSARYFNQKAVYLKELSRYLLKNYNGNLTKLFDKPVPELRAELLSLKGIGNETADSMMCYAGSKSVFVVDGYTHRILERVYGKRNMSYVEVQRLFERSLPKDLKLLQEFHALIVELGKNHCSPKKPRCDSCPCNRFCGFAP